MRMNDVRVFRIANVAHIVSIFDRKYYQRIDAQRYQISVFEV